eukprot:1944365-Amphidinium_carterae.1
MQHCALGTYTWCPQQLHLKKTNVVSFEGKSVALRMFPNEGAEDYGANLKAISHLPASTPWNA